MDARTLLEILHVAERLKDTPRHSWTSAGRRESVAEHSWRLAVMAWFLRDRFPEADWEKVLAMAVLFREMEALDTLEAKIVKALDKLEVLVQHNEADISTWLPLEYDLNMTYGNEYVAFSDDLMDIRREIMRDTVDKIAREGNRNERDKGADLNA